MAWVETVSASFSARHEEEDADDAARVLEELEDLRAELDGLLPSVDDVAVVLHGSPLQLALAHPYLPVLRLCTAPAARRYVVGWYSRREIHVLSPRLLARRASNVPGSLELLMLAPAALYARLLIGAANAELPPPYSPRTMRRWLRWAWAAEGAAQVLSGQVEHVRPAVARRLREGRRPSFPPSLRDATLLGGTVVDLLARERGVEEAVRLVTRLDLRGARRALEAGFGMRMREVEALWREHLAELAHP